MLYRLQGKLQEHQRTKPGKQQNKTGKTGKLVQENKKEHQKAKPGKLNRKKKRKTRPEKQENCKNTSRQKLENETLKLRQGTQENQNRKTIKTPVGKIWK